jgi:hypothetical protein
MRFRPSTFNFVLANYGLDVYYLVLRQGFTLTS